MAILVAVTSSGKNWRSKEAVPTGKMHGVKILQYIVDAEEPMADPVGKLPPLPGTDPKIKEGILNWDGIEEWLAEKIHEIMERINHEAKCDDSENKINVIYHVDFVCKGGFQRSVVFAEETTRRLKEAGYHVILHHMTCSLALGVKKALGKAH